MGSYRLTEEAQADLIRIHQWGVRKYGEARADQYFYDLIDRFEQLAQQPYLYSAVDDIFPGYRRSVCGVDNIYYRILGDEVEIIRILGQQDIEESL